MVSNSYRQLASVMRHPKHFQAFSVELVTKFMVQKSPPKDSIVLIKAKPLLAFKHVFDDIFDDNVSNLNLI